MLETACMKDEPLPEKRVSPGAAQPDLQVPVIPENPREQEQWPQLNGGGRSNETAR